MLVNSDIHLPIVFISGHSDIPMSVRAMKFGAVDVLDETIARAGAFGCDPGGDRTRSRPAAGGQIVAELQERFDSLTPRERKSGRSRRLPGCPNNQTHAAQAEIEAEEDDGEGSSQPSHAKDVSEVFGLFSANSRQTRRVHEEDEVSKRKHDQPDTRPSNPVLSIGVCKQDALEGVQLLLIGNCFGDCRGASLDRKTGGWRAEENPLIPIVDDDDSVLRRQQWTRSRLWALLQRRSRTAFFLLSARLHKNRPCRYRRRANAGNHRSGATRSFGQVRQAPFPPF